MSAANEIPSPFVFTDSAASKVRELIEEEGNPALKLRVFVTGGVVSSTSADFGSSLR
jgi:iron-sulfur cluster insertion protein